MSFKIFTLQLTGKIRDTEKVESERRAAIKNFEAFKEAEKSKELATYLELDGWIKSGEYAKKKKEVEAEVFKGSIEYNQLKEFESLGKNKTILNYFKVEGSADLRRFERLEGSDKLKSYWELKEYVSDGQFQQDKREIETNRFEGSAEQHQLNELAQIQNSKIFKAYQKLSGSARLKNHAAFAKNGKLSRYVELKNAPEKDKTARKEFRKLRSDYEIREYFRFEKSSELKYYREMSGSHQLARYEELCRITGAESFRSKVSFLKDKKKLEKSEPWKKFMRYKELEKSEDVAFYQKFSKSKLYLNYLDVKESFQLKRHQELKVLTASPEFLKRKAYLEDAKKWEKTEEYGRYRQYLQLKKNPKVELYFKYADTHEFDFLKEWEVSFSDDFESFPLDKGKWTPNTFWADKLLGDNFSQPGDRQAYVGGRNCQISQSKLVLQTRKEKSKGKQWIPGQGFIPVEFNYTSDTLSTVNSFWQKEGIFEAKIRFNPVKEVVCSCHLLGENVSPQVTLIEAGPKCRAGLLFRNTSEKPEFQGVDLSNLKKGKFYIFGVEWTNNQLTWKINGQVIFKTEVHHLSDPVHLNLTSLVVNEINVSKLPVSFETDWIRCYRKKS